MTAKELKKLYVDFFTSKSHAEIPSASLVPENDPTTLFISAGMHPLVPFLLGQPHPLGKRLVDIQKCLRTGDIDEVGDTTHHTFFEMLGNWSLGDYFKKEAIEFSFEFLTSKKYLGLDPNFLAITCFAGDENAPKDEESHNHWINVGVPDERIAFLPKENNWWGPAGATGPCGPDTEMFFWTGEGQPPKKFDPSDSNWVEIWNDVFMQYNKTLDGDFVLLEKPNVDTGMGVERTLAVLNGFSDNYQTEIWNPIIAKIEELSNLKYGDQSDFFYINHDQQCWVDVRKSMRLIADHLRTAVFVLADGVEAANKEAGYVLRRVIRRSIREAKKININENFTHLLAKTIIDNQNNYAGQYPELSEKESHIIDAIKAEEIKFRKTLDKGLKEIQKIIERRKNVTGKEAFDLYQSFGFPLEMIVEEASEHELVIDIEEFNRLKSEHIKQSQTLSAGKFKSGLADNSEIITKYHTATHLLHASLRKVLGTHVEQAGSNITSDRLRFDFIHPDKITQEQIKHIEGIVNQSIISAYEVNCDNMKFVEAKALGALAFFGSKYPETVSVYTVGPKTEPFSREVCTGPHVKNTSELGRLKITKEESAGSGKRRLYAVLE